MSPAKEKKKEREGRRGGGASDDNNSRPIFHENEVLWHSLQWQGKEGANKWMQSSYHMEFFSAPEEGSGSGNWASQGSVPRH